MLVEMPVISSCAVSDCAYNTRDTCHARAITVGDGVHPGCDTFLDSGADSQDDSHVGGVGACKVSGCQHNHELSCRADTIEVGRSGSDVRCMTFTPA